MSEIVLIREFDPPIDAGYLEAASVDLGWCRELYGVAPLLHFLARDGRRCACIFGAPDAEAVRNVLRAGNRSEPEGLWACTVHSADDDDGAGDPLAGDAARELVVVERAFAQSAAYEELRALKDRNTPCFQIRNVRHARSYFSLDRRRVICLYAAPDAESVRHANRAAGMPFDRAWPARAIPGI